MPRSHCAGAPALLGAGLVLFAASTAAGGGGGGGQLIWLDFDSGSSPATPDHAYTAAERDEIEAALTAIFAPWGYTFTQTDPSPAGATKVLFNDGGFGTSTTIDFRNEITDGDLAATDAGFALDMTGKPRTSANIVQASINLATHELQHTVGGARHHDAFNPIGAGGGGAGTSSTFQSLTTVLGIDGDRIISPDLYISPRAAMKMEFAAAGTVLSEGPEPNDSPFSASPIARSEFSIPMTVPPEAPMGGVPLVASAASVLGALESEMDLVDYYVFDGKAGEVVTVELMSDVLDVRLDEFDAKIELLAADLSPLALAGGSIDGIDPTVIDILLPEDGPYFIEVTAETPFTGLGEYELLVYSVGMIPVPGALWLLTLSAARALPRPRR